MLNQPPFLPQEIADLKIICGCGNTVRPNFWSDSGVAFEPLEAKVAEGAEKKYWVQKSVIVPCTNCGVEASFETPAIQLKYRIYYYGDDASREFSGFKMVSFTLFGANAGPRDEIADALKEIKRKYVPTHEPDTWRIHAMEMKDAEKRKTHPVYKAFDFESLYEFFGECAELIKQWEDANWNYHVSAIAKRPKVKRERKAFDKYLKVVAHNALLSLAIYNSTKNGLGPFFIFDAEKDIKSYPHIEGWSYDSYAHSRNYLAHLFVANGTKISAPEFVKPGSHAMLELADLHAYLAGNAIFRRHHGQEPLFPLQNFGRMTYISVRDDNHLELDVVDDVPRRFHP